jgi:drug/metabolite transporter (DMT)-like permease
MAFISTGSVRFGSSHKGLFIYLVILCHQVLTAIAFPVAKLGLNQIDPLSYAFFRFVLATVVYVPVLLFLRQRKIIPFRDHIRIFIIGLILIPVNQVVFLIGQSMTSASHSSLLFATVPIFIYILAIVFLKERITFRRSLGIIVAAAGAYIILAGGARKTGGESLTGDLLVLIAVVAWAAATIMAKSMAQTYGAFRVTGLALVYGSILYLPFGAYKVIGGYYGNVSIVGWSSVFYMGIVVSVLAYFLWYWVLKYMEASRLAVIQNIQPVIASAVAVLTLGETIGDTFLIGGAVALGGIILTEIR